MATIVVAHGAWTAGWSWKKMRPLLREQGHELFTPSYTGLGERAHLASPAVDLETHVSDVLGVLRHEDLRDVVLIGHSYGGMVATVVEDRARERIARVVYLDAFVPRDGQCLFDLAPPAQRAAFEAAAQAQGEGWRVPPQALPPDTPPADAQWMLPLRVMHPLAAMRQPVRLAGGQPVPRTYIYCRRAGPADSFRPFAQRARSEPGWTCHEIDASHSPHVTAPEALADLLQRILA
ncbi:alpha/beta hydrolase [Ramlibacter sp. AW1]|uniref:Alpha/beta hydrolase n=1 Tax=Ramlibacter aurantiacus TaxID=2801330 RepID=A0A936ZKR1_9BURK|nr:alpha/beta hydrolase [Ramlibacter aurantiacus]